MYVSAANNKLLSAAGRNCEAALRAFRRLNAVGGPAQHTDQGPAFEGKSVSVTDLLADLLALTGSATLDGLTAQGVGCDQLLCNDELHGRVHDWAGTVAGATLSSTGAVSGSITGAASVGLLSSAGITALSGLVLRLQVR